MAEQFDEFLEEVQNDIRQERWMKLWEKYGKALTTAVTCVILLVAAYTIWQTYEKNQREKTADRFIHALDLKSAGQTQQALLDFSALARTGKGSYLLFSKFQQAALLGQEKTEKGQEEALKIYEHIYSDKKNEAQWRDLASLFSIMIKADKISLDSPQAAESLSSLVTALKPLKESHNPWRYPALELEGTLLFQQGKTQEAAEIFLDLAKDNNAPKGLVLRSQLMAQVLAEQGIDMASSEKEGKEKSENALTLESPAE